MPNPKAPAAGDHTGHWSHSQNMSIGEGSRDSSRGRPAGKRPGKARPGRKPSMIDDRAKLERSRQSARECRARKKLRYQYLEELVLHRERAVCALREELEKYKEWCSQLDTEGRVPEPLLKIIVNEKLMQEKAQREQANRAMLQQQQQQQQEEEIIPAASVLSPTQSSPLSQHKLSHHHHQQLCQSGVDPSLQSPSGSHQMSPDMYQQLRSPSYHRQQHGYPGQINTTTTQHKVCFQRQMALDRLQSEGVMSVGRTSPAASVIARETGDIQSRSSGFHSNTGLLQQRQQQQQQLHHQQQQQQQLQPPLRDHYTNQHQSETSSLTAEDDITPGHFTHRFLPSGRTEVWSVPTSGYDDIQELSTSSRAAGSSLHASLLDLSAGLGIRRVRSYSNPASTMRVRGWSPRGSSTHSPSRPSDTATRSSGHVTPGHGLGLFSGASMGSGLSPLARNVPTSATVEESSSSDENVNEQQLFQSTLTSQDRLLGDLTAPDKLSLPPVVTAPVTFDPHVTLHNLTTVYCLSSTRTCNTSSPSPVGLSPRPGSPSAIHKYKGTTSSTSSSAATSPAPLSSVSSVVELSPGSTSSTRVDSSEPLHAPGHRFSSSLTDTLACSATALSASIDEPIPELYSFLADLADGGMSSLSSRHGASSSHSTPLALTPKQYDQPLTPDPACMNVPKIIDEFLHSDSQDS